MYARTDRHDDRCHLTGHAGEAPAAPRAGDSPRARFVFVAPGRRGARDAAVPGSRRPRRDPAAPRAGRYRAARRDPAPGPRLAQEAVAGCIALWRQPRRAERVLLRRPRQAPPGHGGDHPVPRPAHPLRRIVPPAARPRMGPAGRDRLAVAGGASRGLAESHGTPAGGSISLAGVAFALTSGAFWAMYIVTGA